MSSPTFSFLLIIANWTLGRYAFNAWIPLISYNTNYAPRFLVGNSVTVGLIVCAACTLGLAVYLQRRDEQRSIDVESESEEGAQVQV